MANQIRGDVPVDIGGEPMALRPSFGAVAEIEAACNASIARLSFDAQESNLRASHIMHCLFYGLRAAGHKVSRQDLAAELEQRGMLPFIGPVVAFCGRFLAGTAGLPGDDEDGAGGAEDDQPGKD